VGSVSEIAQWHLPNRILLAKDRPIVEILKVVPLRCHWCGTIGTPKTMTISGSLAIQCVNLRACNRARKQAVGAPERPLEAPQRRSRTKRRGQEPQTAEEPKKKRCRSFYDEDRTIRCTGPEGHGGSWHKNRNRKKKWPVEK
jgi:hypothetical protein